MLQLRCNYPSGLRRRFDLALGAWLYGADFGLRIAEEPSEHAIGQSSAHETTDPRAQSSPWSAWLGVLFGPGPMRA